MTHPHTNVRRVLLVTLALNLLVAFGKIVAGLMTGALAILADGFHSLSDAAGNVAALIADHIASQPPDEDHPYGHRRFETVGALSIGVLLLLTSWEVIQSVGRRLLNPEASAVITPLTVGVLLLTLAVNLGVSIYQRRAGERLGSELLLADAANTRADVYVTASVLASTALVWITGALWWDTAVAVVVAGLIVQAAVGVLWRAGGVLVDTAPYEPGTLHGWVADMPGVLDVRRVRSRGTASAAHIDVDVAVHPEMTCGQTATLADGIRERIAGAVRDCGGEVVEVEVHFCPALETTKRMALE